MKSKKVKKAEPAVDIKLLAKDEDFDYILLDGLVLVERDTDTETNESCELSEKDAEYAQEPGRTPRELRALMYRYSGYN